VSNINGHSASTNRAHYIMETRREDVQQSREMLAVLTQGHNVDDDPEPAEWGIRHAPVPLTWGKDHPDVDKNVSCYDVFYIVLASSIVLIIPLLSPLLY